jgi:hypothetical protein
VAGALPPAPAEVEPPPLVPAESLATGDPLLEEQPRSNPVSGNVTSIKPTREV